jgi:hypothetical protein
MTTTRMPKTLCPACHHTLDAASGLGLDGAPSAGDFTVCIACGTPLRFTHDGGVREFTTDDFRELAADPKCFEAMQKLMQAVATLPRSMRR